MSYNISKILASYSTVSEGFFGGNMKELLQKLQEREPVFWLNPKADILKKEYFSIKEEQLDAAEARLKRFRRFINVMFDETNDRGGIIESDVIRIPHFTSYMNKSYGPLNSDNVLMKDDAHLAISGSIKARGGIYAVLKLAEDLAVDNGLIDVDVDYSQFASKKFYDFFSNYTILVGSTGNLGLSIGLIGKALGFHVEVHMSSDAKEWKKQKLRNIGATVVEYESDYSEALNSARELATCDNYSYFIDDENSLDLFLGYSVAARRTKSQLDNMGINPTVEKPLYVYLPCGVGGAPGGVAYGLKMIYGDAVKPIFAEPVESPCMLLGLTTGRFNNISVQDIGLTNKTEADGLAVGRPSGFVGQTMERLLHGAYTVEDKTLFQLLNIMFFKENIYLEPSSLAGAMGPWFVKEYYPFEDDAYHLIWSTGGGMVPDYERDHHKDSALKSNNVNVTFFDALDDDLVKIVIIISTYKGKLVFGKHKYRKTYEFPGGHIELGERTMDAARRELEEETSAINYKIEPVCYYSVTDEYSENFGKLFFATITDLSENLVYEIEELMFSDAPPQNTTYPYVVDALLKEAKRRGFI